MRHLTHVVQFSREDVEALYERVRAKEFALDVPKRFESKILGTLFFTASTRTRHGYESAMLRIGGRILPIDTMLPRAGPNSDESIRDAVHVISQMCDVLVARFARPDDLTECLSGAQCSIINGGNGSGQGAEHPTQALSDLFFINERGGTLIDNNILLIGGMSHRVIRSLVFLFAIMGRRKVHVAHLDSQDFLPEDIMNLRSLGLEVARVEDVNEVAAEFDVIYHNGVPHDKSGVDPKLCLEFASAQAMKKSALIMHSMPRYNEYPITIDSLPQAAYFDQAKTTNEFRMQVLADVMRGLIQSEH